MRHCHLKSEMKTLLQHVKLHQHKQQISSYIFNNTDKTIYRMLTYNVDQVRLVWKVEVCTNATLCQVNI